MSTMNYLFHLVLYRICGRVLPQYYCACAFKLRRFFRKPYTARLSQFFLEMSFSCNLVGIDKKTTDQDLGVDQTMFFTSCRSCTV